MQVALIAPASFYPLHEASTPDMRLVDVLSPVPSLFVIWLVMVMVFIHGRRAFVLALVCWSLIALPVLVYLALHPREMWMLRGIDLLMAYEPVSAAVAGATRRS